MDLVFLIRRYLVTRRIVLVATLCLAFAVCAMIVVTSVMDGFRSRIRENVRSVEPDLRVRFREDPPAQHADQILLELKEEMESQGGPIAHAAPSLIVKGLLVADEGGRLRGSTNWSAIEAVGVDWHEAAKVLPLDRIVQQQTNIALPLAVSPDGDPLADRPVPGILVGAPLAANVGLASVALNLHGVTTRVSLHTGQPTFAEDGEIDLELANLDFDVTGGFESGRGDFDIMRVFVDRRYLHSLRYGRDSTEPDCSELMLALVPEKREMAGEIQSALQARHPNLVVESWEDRNRDLMNALKVEKRTMSLVLGLVVLISASLILALLYMMVVEKTRDIGVLRSMGMSTGRLKSLFLGYGLTLGLIGATLGTIAGVLVVRNLTAITDWFDDKFGIQVFSRQVMYRFHEIPAILSRSQVTWIFAITVLLSVLAALTSAWKAASYDPIRCLRHE